MVVDSSALLAILRKEAEASVFLDILLASPARQMSVGNALEVSIVTEAKYGLEARRTAEMMMYKLGIVLQPFTLQHLHIAQQAFSRFGKGRHPAKLNFGDCMAYALSKASNQPLLFKGNDFSQTDIVTAV